MIPAGLCLAVLVSVSPLVPAGLCLATPTRNGGVQLQIIAIMTSNKKTTLPSFLEDGGLHGLQKRRGSRRRRHRRDVGVGAHVT